MRILYVGNYRHPFCTEVHLTRELEALGHEVDRFQEPPGGGNHDTLQQINDAAFSSATPADLVMWQRTWGLPDEATDLWRSLEDDGVATASYHLDLYVGLDRQPRTAPNVLGNHHVLDPFWTTSHVFSADGDPASQAWFEAHGVNHHWMPAGVVSDACVNGEPKARYPQPVVFVGSAWENYHREWTHRRDLLVWLEQTYGDQFKRWGGDVRGGPVREQALNDLYASAAVVVGDSFDPMIECDTCEGTGVRPDDPDKPGMVQTDPTHLVPRTYATVEELVCSDCDGQGNRRQRNYWSDRPYETIGRGGFLIHPRVPGLEEHFTDGEHICFYEYGDFDQLGHMIDMAIADPQTARAIAAAGQAHVREHHTYRHRLARAIEIMGLA